MIRVKIFGAGSIGNHLAHASRSLGWEVTVCDVSEAALLRMREDIYPLRYGSWDKTIQQFVNDSAPRGGYDLILIGTPPPYHVPLALQALHENPRAIMIEKPLCLPSLIGAQELYEASARSQTKIFVGYDHVVSRASRYVERLLREGQLGRVLTLDVEFREHWAGIFKAHPWLRGPEDTYLGYWEQGGGASGEHSHALNLWQHFTHALGFGRVQAVSACMQYAKEGKAEYDQLYFATLRTEDGLLGRVVQDVVTIPSRKRVLVQGTESSLEWAINYSAEGDAVIHRRPGQADQIQIFPKTRPDDFLEELKHLQEHLENPSKTSPLGLERGLETMLVLAASHQSAANGSTIYLDYDQGFTNDALRAEAKTDLSMPFISTS